ncbi:MAG: Crp/Fnr family transcriptional regulator [Rhodoferax sp.]|nr:Crp/Fnr family transcriptional regulator [Betaproteobacteria bacterium]NCN96273.1 Crp/Fnr family transcriptional regulator [Rhodoferax sp.]OIP18303.1 MAG: Crp/Fnr family transcriptional regulator [Comamonadaceae bacterium CG2_30_57_122]PJC12833.1 MAG: Crp/Fnr family transcriptional regulator [Comamonadaceae bacterium CG_4_9_14_0_8_um_filter_57_21]NCP83057.1 Crp/Fnr family transcriptional regulator [Rhodoferax sp.]
MFSIHTLDPTAAIQKLPRGQLLLKRGVGTPTVSYIESGRVALGVLEGDVMDHQIGVLEGPCWLDASSAVLGLPHLADAVADSPVQLRQVSLKSFRQGIQGLPESAQAVLCDVAMAHRRQTEFAVSRLAKDAEARCAEWLLSHAQAGDQGGMEVELHQRKRSIATQLGIAPETFSRVLRHLREQSLISGSGRVLNLVNPHALKSLAGV